MFKIYEKSGRETNPKWNAGSFPQIEAIQKWGMGLGMLLTQLLSRILTQLQKMHSVINVLLAIVLTSANFSQGAESLALQDDQSCQD